MGNLYKTKEKKGSFEKDCVQILYTLLRKYRKVKKDINKKKWLSHFNSLRHSDGVERERIQKVLSWYTNHLTDRYTPKAYSASSFRSKFYDIEDAMIRDLKQGRIFGTEEDFTVTFIKDDDESYEFEIDW